MNKIYPSAPVALDGLLRHGMLIAEGKGHKDFGAETYILEEGIFADLSIVKAWRADDTGNLIFRKTARNFNPPAAMCGKVCVAEVEEIVPRGSLDPDHLHRPGIYVHCLIQGSTKNASNSAPCVRVRRPEHALGRQSDGPACRAGTRRRDVCQSWHRHSDAGGQLYRRQGHHLAVGKRYAGHGPFSP